MATDYTRLMAPEITYIAGTRTNSVTLTYPTESQAVAGLGGNLQDNVVPEPSISSMIVLSAFGGWDLRRHRERPAV